MTDEEFTALVNQHGYTFGYGRMMQIIADEWAKRDKRGASLTVGPCKYFVDTYGDYHSLLEKYEARTG